jgi:peroxiredoxin
LLQALSQQLREAGLRVVGFDRHDDPARLGALLRKHGVNYPCAWDTTAAGLAVRQGYEPTLPQTSADPLTYIIGRDGKVVSAWYGYGEKQLRAALAEAGLPAH